LLPILFSWPIAALPGDISPDSHFKALVARDNLRAEIAAVLLKTEEQLTLAINATAGLDGS
jgi:hypothetical protein